MNVLNISGLSTQTRSLCIRSFLRPSEWFLQLISYLKQKNINNWYIDHRCLIQSSEIDSKTHSICLHISFYMWSYAYIYLWKIYLVLCNFEWDNSFVSLLRDWTAHHFSSEAELALQIRGATKKLEALENQIRESKISTKRTEMHQGMGTGKEKRVTMELGPN